MRLIDRAVVRLLAGAWVVLSASGVQARRDAPTRVDGAAVERTALSAPAASRVPEGLSGSDWSSIRAAYERGRHAVVAVPGTTHTWRARTPGQQWTTTFDGRGFEVTPDSGGWTWGLQLARYGIDGAEVAVKAAARVGTDGSRITYTRGSSLDEWFVNDTRGLEHGFTLREPPGSGAGPVVLELAVQGGLTPRVQADGHSIAFSRGDAAVVIYAALSVVDADGRALPARFESKDALIRLVVDDANGRYPLTIDPIAQQAYLKASNTDGGDQFGWSVAVSGDTVVVGAVLEDSSATGVNGDGTNNNASGAGAAYVFVRSGGVWGQQAYLKASNTGAGDNFGYSVAVSGDTVVVGSYGEDSSATGVNGDQADNSVAGAGAAYVFVRSGGVWGQQAYLKASNTGASDAFGESLAVSGDTILVGAPFEASSAIGVNGDQANNSASQAGAAYVFVRVGGVWSQQAYLKASNTGASDWFGASVAVSGDTVVAGAMNEGSNATGVNGNQSNNSAAGAGAAYVFVRSSGVWTQEAYLKASNTGSGDGFGGPVGVSGDTVVVGAMSEGSNATGVNGDQSNNLAVSSGAAYVFVRSGGVWSQQAYLKASNTDAGDRFGAGAAVSGDMVVVGAYQEASSATGVNGNEADDSASSAGAAYVFVRSAGVWSQQAYLKASNTGAGDRFGQSVAVSGDTVVVGALLEGSNATGVNGDQTNNSAAGAGAAYTFLLPDPSPSVVSVTPASGSGPSQTFGYVFSDPDGFADISWTAMMMAGASGGYCVTFFDRASSSLLLLNDAFSGWLGPVTAGGVGTLQNSQCLLDAAGSSTSGATTNLTVNVALTFKGAFAGPKATIAVATDVGAHTSGWQATGTFTATNPAPTVTSVTPSSGNGSSQTFAYLFADANGFADIAWTAMLVNGSVSAVNSCVVYVDRASGAILLLNDAATTWLGPVIAGNVGTVQNAQCTVNAAGSSLVGAGSNLTVNLLLIFNPAFTGAKFNIAIATDTASQGSGWQVPGTWTVP